MTDEVRPLLGAYHDGELSKVQSRHVEAHLTECAACRGELAGLERLSGLLAMVAVPPATMSSKAFAAQVALRLPHRAEPDGWHRVARAAWWAVPVVLILGWALMQAVLLTTGLLLAALRLGLGGDALASVLPGDGAAWGLATGLPATGSLGALLSTVPADVRLLLPLAWLALMTIGIFAYWSWLASLRARTEQQHR